MNVAAESQSLFTSVSALRAAHRDLQRALRVQGDSMDLQDRIEAFLRQAQATGAILDSEDDQASVQSIIDLWVTTLYRAGRHTGDFTLAEFDPLSAPKLDDVLAPYVGLAAFGEKEREMFFGRQKMIEHLLDRLKTENFLCIIGPSGSGKSSLVLAGLLPAIRNGALPGSADWVVLKRVVPGSDPLTNLARCMQPVAAEAGWSASQSALMRRDPDHLKKLADAYGGARTCLLVIDQLEELSTLCDDETDRAAVEENLIRLAASNNPRHLILATMRSDFIGIVARQTAMQTLMERGLEPVTPLSAPELREAIEKPAERVGLKFEPGVVEALVHDILGEPAALPLLQFTLLKLWERRERNRVTAAAYRELGGGRLALTRSADKFYDSLIPQEKTMVDRILLRMVRPGQGQDVVSSRIRRRSLDSIGDAEQVDRAVKKLVAERLIRLTENDSSEAAEVEVAHEALVRNWGHLVQLLDSERERMTRGRRLQAKAADWVRLGRGKAGLLAGVVLAEAEDWIRGEDAVILGASPELRALILASERAEKAAAKRAFWIRTALIALTVLSVFFAVVSLIKRHEAETQTHEAKKHAEAALFNWEAAKQANATISAQAKRLEKDGEELKRKEEALKKLARDRDEKAHLYDSDHLADASGKTLSSDPDVSTLRAVESAVVMDEVGKPATNETQDALRQAILANRAKLVITGHGGKVEDAAFSPDGRYIATAGGGKPLHFWNSLTGTAEPPLSASSGSTIRFSLPGDWATDEGTHVRVHFADGQNDKLLGTEGHRVTRLAFSPDGHRLAAAAGTVAFVWDLPAGTHKVLPSSNLKPSNINAVALSFDGGLVATAGDDEIGRVYDASTGELLRELRGHVGAVRDIVFSPVGTQIATAGEDRTLKTWNWLDPSQPDPQPRTLHGHMDAVTSVAYSPDGTRLATASRDRTAKIWVNQTGVEEFTLSGHGAAVRTVQFSVDNSRLLTGDDDGVVRLWNAGPAEDVQTTYMGVTPGSTATAPSVKTAALVVAGSDGRTFVSSTSDGAFRIWTVTGQGLVLRRIIHRTASSQVVAINQSATIAAAVSPTGTAIQVYDLNSGGVRATIEGSAGRITAIAVSPDGKSVISGSIDKQLRVWDIESGHSTSAPLGATVGAVAFSPDGKRVAAAGRDGVAVVMEASLKRQIAVFSKHAGSLSAIAFSPDGRRIVTGGHEKIARVWNIDQPTAPALELADHTNWILGVSFSPDGRRVATVSADGTAKVWQAAGKIDPEPYTFAGPPGLACSVTFTQDGTRLITAGYDRSLRVYELLPRGLLALALSRISRLFVASDCLGQKEPGHCRDMLPAMNMIAAGNRLARAGRLEDARARYGELLGTRMQLTPNDILRQIDNANDNDKRRLNVDGRLARARALAVAGEIDRSNQLLDEAMKIREVDGQTRDFDPKKLNNLPEKATLYKQLATMVVRTKDDDEHAFEYFLRYLELNSQARRDLNSQVRTEVSLQATTDNLPRAKQLMFLNLQYVSKLKINQKQSSDALKVYARARKYATDGTEPNRLPESDPLWLNLLCWRGSLGELYAKPDVRQACELAVSLTNSKDASFVDSRGLNRALNGDFPGAIQDFERYADDLAKPSKERQKRRDWVAILKTERSPFNEQLIKRLTEEDELGLIVSPPSY